MEQPSSNRQILRILDRVHTLTERAQELLRRSDTLLEKSDRLMLISEQCHTRSHAIKEEMRMLRLYADSASCRKSIVIIDGE
jgi:hypothetical protein